MQYHLCIWNANKLLLLLSNAGDRCFTVLIFPNKSKLVKNTRYLVFENHCSKNLVYSNNLLCADCGRPVVRAKVALQLDHVYWEMQNPDDPNPEFLVIELLIGVIANAYRINNNYK